MAKLSDMGTALHAESKAIRRQAWPAGVTIERVGSAVVVRGSAKRALPWRCTAEDMGADDWIVAEPIEAPPEPAAAG